MTVIKLLSSQLRYMASNREDKLCSNWTTFNEMQRNPEAPTNSAPESNQILLKLTVHLILCNHFSFLSYVTPLNIEPHKGDGQVIVRHPQIFVHVSKMDTNLSQHHPPHAHS